MVFTVLKVEAVEVVPLHQIAQGLRFKGGQARITNLTEDQVQSRRGLERDE